MSKFQISLIFYFASIAGISVWLYADDVAAMLFFCILITLFYSFALAAMSMLIRLNFYLKAVNQNSTNKIVLTFDDGPHPTETIKVLQILDNFKIKAVFFMIGKNVAQYPEIAKEVVKRGHQIGIHTQNHDWYFGFLMGKTLVKELTNCRDEIKKATGINPVIFRPPFGITNPNLAKATKKLNVQTIGWNTRTFDTVAKTTDKIIYRALHKLKPNNIILLHDRIALTTKALPEIIEKARNKGFSFGPLFENEMENKQ